MLRDTVDWLAFVRFLENDYRFSFGSKCLTAIPVTVETISIRMTEGWGESHRLIVVFVKPVFLFVSVTQSLL